MPRLPLNDFVCAQFNVFGTGIANRYCRVHQMEGAKEISKHKLITDITVTDTPTILLNVC